MNIKSLKNTIISQLIEKGKGVFIAKSSTIVELPRDLKSDIRNRIYCNIDYIQRKKLYIQQRIAAMMTTLPECYFVFVNVYDSSFRDAVRINEPYLEVSVHSINMETKKLFTMVCERRKLCCTKCNRDISSIATLNCFNRCDCCGLIFCGICISHSSKT